MKTPEQYILPDRESFAADPISYSAMAWHKWGMAQCLAGFHVDISQAPSSEDLKSPVLWLTHAHALAESARIVFQNEPNLEHMPIHMKGTCDSQYCAVGLMLVAYSLEICLKAMLIIRKGIEAYADEERSYKHHQLRRLANFIPELTEKDRAILEALTHFSVWAGRYPDPGSGRTDDAEKLFSLAETHRITARDLFELARRVMRHTQSVVD